MRVRLTFAKTEAMRYTSHLDLYRALERTIRRAKLPLLYSQGFKPHPRINLASALPLGFTGEAELVDVWFEDSISCEEILSALEHKTPPGLQITAAHPAPERAGSMQSELAAVEFLVTLLDPIPDLVMRLEKLNNAASLPRERRGKAYDLRPLVEELYREADDDFGCPRLHMRMTAKEGATGRPEEVVAALGGNPLAARYHRLRLIFPEPTPET